MTLLQEGKLYIDGKLRDAEGGAKYEDIGPWTGEVVGYAADASANDMEEAIASARRAFDESDWTTNRAKRRELVWKLCEKLRASRDRLAELAVQEGGAAVEAAGLARHEQAGADDVHHHADGGDDHHARGAHRRRSPR